MIHDATPAEGCRICLDSCVSSNERHLSKILVAFFFPFLESLPLGEPPQRFDRLSPQGCTTPARKAGQAASAAAVFTAQSEDGGERGRYQKITETRMKGRLCDTYPEFERTIARTSLIPFPRTTGNYPATEIGTRRAPLSFVPRAFLSLFFFFVLHGLINLVLRLIA